MRVVKALLAAVLASGTALCAASEKNAPPLSAELRRVLHAAEAIAGRGDPATSAMAFEAAASHADFELAPARHRAAILLRAAQLATDAGDLDRARRLAAASVDADDRNPDGWFLLGQLAASQDRDADAAAAFARLVEGWPEAAGHLTPQMVNPVVHGLGLDSQPRLDLLQALFKAGWTMHGIPPDHAWAQLALMRADRGDATGARAALAGIASPGVLAWIRSDRRFDPLFDRDDPRYDPVPAAKAWVTRLRAAAAAAPASLALQGELGQALLVAGHPEEALALADAAIAAPAGFDDAGELHWMLNLRAVASRRLGRTADALAALAGAAAMDESGAPNVSQVLNLGTLLADMQRPMEALAAVARVGGTSGYGDMVQSMTRLRAHRQLGQDDDAAVWFERMRANRDHAPTLYLDALLWTGRDDDAADWLVAMLDGVDRRADALDWCRGARRSAPLPGRVPFVEARRALLARARVQEAIQRVGRIEDTGLYASVGID